MKNYRKIIAGTACFLSLAMLTAALLPTHALPAGDEHSVTVSSFSKSQKPTDPLTFTRDDFTSRVTGNGKLSGIIVSGLPSKELGQLMVGAEPADMGETIELDNIEALCFAPASEQDIQATLEFIPIFEKTGASAVPVSISLNLSAKENSAPIALDKQYETYTSLPLYACLGSVDLENEPCTYTILSYPTGGDVIIDKDNFNYTPTSKNGRDSFTYTATDAVGNVSKEATVKISVVKRPKDSKITYSDMSVSSAHYQAIKLAEAGVLTGESFGSNSFLVPTKPVSRAEFTALAAAIAQLSTPTMAVSSGMSDNAAIPTWAQPYVSAALHSGIIDGERGSDGNHFFRPSDSITRAEAAKIISRISGALPSGESAFSDSANIPAWAANDIACASAAGLIETFSDGSIRANSLVTREDAVKMLYETMKYMSKNEKTGIFQIFN